MDGARGNKAATQLAVSFTNRCLVSPSGDVDRLLHRTEEEEEIEAKGLNVSSDIDDDFLILDEAKVDDDESAERNNVTKADGQEADGATVVSGGVQEGPACTSSPKAPEADKASDEEFAGKTAHPDCKDGDKAKTEEKPEDEDEKKDSSGEKREKDDHKDGMVTVLEVDKDESKSIEDTDRLKIVDSLDSTASTKDFGKEDKKKPVEKPVEKSVNSCSDNVPVAAVEQLTDKKPDTKESTESGEVDASKNGTPLHCAARNVDSAAPAAGVKKAGHGKRPAVADDGMPMESKALKNLVHSGGRIILADLKRSLNVEFGPGKPKRLKLDTGDDEAGSLDFEALSVGGANAMAADVVVGAVAGSASSSGRDLLMVSRKQLEQYILRQARNCLQQHGAAVLKPMEKKCDALHIALERWRRRSYQLQRQLNEFICEQEKCTNARRGRRSVGVCVRMPPLKQLSQPPLLPQPPPQLPKLSVKTIPTTVTAPASVVASRAASTVVTTVATSGTSPVRPPAPLPQQLRVTGASASMLAAQLGLKPNQHMKLVSVSTPSGGTTTVVTRIPPQVRPGLPLRPIDGRMTSSSVQLQSAPPSSTSAAPPVPTSGPVPMQLIANTATLASAPNTVAKAVGLPTSPAPPSTVATSPIRTVAVLPPPGVAAGSAGSAASGVKFIDLTQEEEAGNAQGKVVSVSGVSVANAIQKMGVPTSGIPVLSAAPTSLVQMPPSSSHSHTRMSLSGTSVVLTPVTGTVSQSGGTVRLNSPLVASPTRVTYLVPSLPAGMVVTPREVGPPRLAPGGSAQPMQTILLRMSSPQGGFTPVPGGITMGNLVPANPSGGPTAGGAATMMVATAPSGSQVRMVRAPPPMTLQRGGTTLTLPPGTTLVRGSMGTAATIRPGTEQVTVVRQPTAGTAVAPPSLQLPTVRVHVPKPPALQLPPKPPTLQVPSKPPTLQVPSKPPTLQVPSKPPTLQVPPKPPALQLPPKLVQQVQAPTTGPTAANKQSPSKSEPVASLIKTSQHPAALPPMPRYIDDPKKKRIPPKPSLKISRTASGLVLSWNMTFNSLYADIQTYQLYAYQETNAAPATSFWKKVGDVRALPLPMACTLTQFVDGHKYHFAVRAVDVHNRLGPFSDPTSILLK